MKRDPLWWRIIEMIRYETWWVIGILALAFIALMIVLPGFARAQTLVVDMNRAVLQWQWAPGSPPNDGVASEFLVRCGPTSGNYTRVTVVSDPAARSVSIRQVISGSGVWYCTVAAANKYGTSPNDGEVNFDGGAAPSSPTSVIVAPQ